MGEGTSVKVYLPRTIDAAEASTASVAPIRRHHKGAVILLVDDDSAVREVTASMLRELGYVILEVGSGGAALDLLGGTNVDLVVLDFAMPGMNGIEVAKQVHSRFPNLPVLFITGFADQSALGNVDDAGIIKKPFLGDELANKVDAALGPVSVPSNSKLVPLNVAL